MAGKMTTRKRWGIIGGIAVGLIVMVGIVMAWFIGVHDSAVKKEEQIENAASEIDNNRQNRVDALSQMIQAVQQSSAFEEETLTALTEARATAQDGAAASSEVSIAAVAEAYPELKSVEIYQDVARESAKIENNLRGARTNYNNRVTDYKSFSRTAVNRFILNVQGYEIRDYERFEENESSATYDPTTDNLWENE